MIGTMMPRIIRTRDKISKSLIHIALLYRKVKRGLFKKKSPSLSFPRGSTAYRYMAAPGLQKQSECIIAQVLPFDKIWQRKSAAFLDKLQKQIYTENEKSAADRRSALGQFKENEPTLWAVGRFISSLCRWGFEWSNLRSLRPKIKSQNHSCFSSLSPYRIEGYFHIQEMFPRTVHRCASEGWTAYRYGSTRVEKRPDTL